MNKLQKLYNIKPQIGTPVKPLKTPYQRFKENHIACPNCGFYSCLMYSPTFESCRKSIIDTAGEDANL